ncbi:MAG: rod shape-determining protein RodA [Candidatus Omnitrophica bacterium]|nr:rod shape-determining protein RodA [Candidatus Omnitrophota bacterium]MCM8768890.1 rod shape-determining protein RodA [Candidatus Omnitrophota bacterium]
MKISESSPARRLLGLAYGLVAIGLILLFSASKGIFTRPVAGIFKGGGVFFWQQLLWITLGTGALVGARRFPYRNFRRLVWLLYPVTIVLLVLVLSLGHGRASRWIRIGPFNFQPAEFGKVVLVLTIAAYLAENDINRIAVFIGSLFLAGFPAALIFKQPNLGTAMILVLICLVIMFQAGLSLRRLLAVFITVLVSSPLLWITMEPYQKERILTFLWPQRDPLGRGYNLLQSKITIGSGGLIGKGYLHGTQTKLAFLPEYHTDFIFCLLAEEFGFIGVAIFLGLVYLFLREILSIIASTRDEFARLVASGIFGIFFLQTVINISMTLGLFPVAGIPLPFISYGGSFMIVALLSVGILANIAENSVMF